MTTAAPALTLTPADLTGDYVIDPTHSRIGFIARHAMVTKVRGSFNAFDGKARLDFGNPAASSAEISVEVASVDTRQAQRDEHLRTNDFFDAPTYPTINFASSGVEQIDGNTFRLVGMLTIKDVTRPVTVDFEYTGAAKDPYGNIRVGFEGSTTLNRSDYGVTFNAALETGGVLVSEKITLEFEVSAVKNA
jgi:polyisoprenoid-binding protein YceI